MKKDDVPAVMCTLTTKDMASQVLEWADLARLATSRQRQSDGVVSTYSLEHADAIEELAAREMDCCGSWLTITTRRDVDAFHLQVNSANPGRSGSHRVVHWCQLNTLW